MYAVSDSKKIDFDLTSTKILISLFVVFALSTAVLGLMLHQSKIETAISESKNNTYMIEATKAKSKLESANKTIRELEAVQDDYISKMDFFENNIVFCDDESNYYHKYECNNWNRNSFYAYNTENAIYQGYTPCPKCCN